MSKVLHSVSLESLFQLFLQQENAEDAPHRVTAARSRSSTKAAVTTAAQGETVNALGAL